MDDRLNEQQRKLQDDLFSKIDHFLENKPPSSSQAYGDAVGDIFDAVNGCLYADNDDEPPDLTGDVVELLISYAEWMRQRRSQQ